MNRHIAPLAILLCLCAGGCQSKNHVEGPQTTSSSEAAPPAAKEVNRYEFVETELLPNPDDETEFNHYYMGSLEGYDYITVRGRTYKIPSEQLGLTKSFPLTKDDTKWLPFSDPLLARRVPSRPDRVMLLVN